MKVILIAFVLLLSTTAVSQTITDTTLIMGRLLGNYFIFDIPKNPEGNGLKLLSPGEFVYIIGIVSTPKNPPYDLWYHCFYKSIEGYIPTSKVEVYGNWSTDKLNYLEANKDKSFEERLALSRTVSTREGNISDLNEKKDKEHLDSVYVDIEVGEQKIIKNLGLRAKQDKLLILSYSYPLSILDYPGFKVRFMNGSKKSIKYATFKITAYNAVNDIEATKEVKCIGEIQPFDNKEYEFENVFLSKVCDHFSIPIVKIQYMDNSIVTISGNELLIRYLQSPMEKISLLKDYEIMLRQVYGDHLRKKLDH
ncbi:MAG TPA: hypothetical protein VII44_08125 [Puia sp.]